VTVWLQSRTEGKRETEERQAEEDDGAEWGGGELQRMRKRGQRSERRGARSWTEVPFSVDIADLRANVRYACTCTSANYYGETSTKAHPNILRWRRGHESIVHSYVSTRALLVYARTHAVLYTLWYIIEYEVAGRAGMLIPWLSPAAAGSPIHLCVCPSGIKFRLFRRLER